MRECECGCDLDANDECPDCAADLARMNREYGWGDVRAAMAPVARTWRSREDLIRELGASDL